MHKVYLLSLYFIVAVVSGGMVETAAEVIVAAEQPSVHRRAQVTRMVCEGGVMVYSPALL